MIIRQLGVKKMNILKRVFVSLSRNWLKSVILFFLLLILSTLIAGAILVHQAIMNTDQSLRRRMPSIVTVSHYISSEEMKEIYNQTGKWPEFEFATLEVIREIAEFPEVRTFDYSIDMGWGVTGRNLNLWENPNNHHFFSIPGSYDENFGVRLYMRGVSSADFLELRDDFFVLEEGRAFYDDEMDILGDVNPAIIMSGFAQTNNLNIGSVFEAQVIIFEEIESIEFSMDELEVALEVSFQLEVVGIIDTIIPEVSEEADFDTAFQNHVQQSLQQHRIYVPNTVAEAMFHARAIGPGEPTNVVFHNFFILNDPMEMATFSERINNLPGFWEVIDLSSGFSDISASMENMHNIADITFFVATLASVLIISLLLTFYLYERKHEIGIYLALTVKSLD